LNFETYISASFLPESTHKQSTRAWLESIPRGRGAGIDPARVAGVTQLSQSIPRVANPSPGIDPARVAGVAQLSQSISRAWPIHL